MGHHSPCHTRLCYALTFTDWREGVPDEKISSIYLRLAIVKNIHFYNELYLFAPGLKPPSGIYALHTWWENSMSHICRTPYGPT